ncbi:MAG TPA: endonuclease/exonuclease/phosphatase family protein [Steroidobacteraceae bacterium]|nr:endonuclease/exonuclease/phosphatase family protein [Steroidobacteraceae bacterium]
MSEARIAATSAGRDRTVSALAVALALAYAGAQFPGPFAVLDNLSNFPAHFAAAFLGCAALFAWRRRALPALACAALAALALARVVPWYFGAEPVPADPARPWVRLLVSNVYSGNRHPRRLLALVRQEDPDVVGLIEVDSWWLRRLRPLQERYPYHYEVPDEHYAGLAIYSRVPIKEVLSLSLPGERAPHAVAATLMAPGGSVELVLAHPMSPIGAEYIAKRNAQVADIARAAAAAHAPLVLAGDLNLTMWNDAYRPLEDVAGLRNARQGHGIQPTWPALGPLGVPIDHVLASPGVHVRNFRVLPGIGSDHFPIAAEFSAR